MAPRRRVASAPTGERALNKHTNWVNSVAVCPDGKHVVSGSGDNTVRIWSMADGSL